MHPLSNLIATDQVRGGDLLKIDFDATFGGLSFIREAEDMPAYAMARMVETSTGTPLNVVSTCAAAETNRLANARGSRR